MSPEEAQADLHQRAAALEQQAHDFHAQQKITETFRAYDEAANLYREVGEHLKAATCFAAAATCWSIHARRHSLLDAAIRNEKAAQQAMLVSHYDYARLLFREAARLYEEEGDAEHYSNCFVASQLADLKRSWATISGNAIQSGIAGRIRRRDRLWALLRLCLNILSRWVWGYGEHPFRTLICVAVTIVASACFYTLSSSILTEGIPRHVSFFEALYMSVITFSTVGYGDYLPLGWARFVAGFEALSGMTLVPLFLVGLTRRYLRLYR